MNSTVTGLVLGADEAPINGASVVFTPLSILEFRAAGTLAQQSSRTIATGVDGTFSVSLPSGRYRVSIDGKDSLNTDVGVPFSIRVPNDGGTYAIATLLENSALIYS